MLWHTLQYTFSYPVLMPQDGPVFVLFCVASVVFPLLVLALYACIVHHTPRCKEERPVRKKYSVSRILGIILCFMIGIPTAFYTVGYTWKHVKMFRHDIKLNGAVAALLQDTDYTDIKMCKKEYISITAKLPENAQYFDTADKLCGALYKNDILNTSIGLSTSILVSETPWEQCIEEIWFKRDFPPGNLLIWCSGHGKASISFPRGMRR